MFHLFFSFSFANYARTADQNVASPARAQSAEQHNTAQRKQLCKSSSWHYQDASCTKSWTFYFLPSSHLFFLFSLRERSGRRQPPPERSPCKLYSGDIQLHTQPTTSVVTWVIPGPSNPRTLSANPTKLERDIMAFNICCLRAEVADIPRTEIISPGMTRAHPRHCGSYAITGRLLKQRKH